MFYLYLYNQGFHRLSTSPPLPTTSSKSIKNNMISYIRKKYTEIWKNTILKTNTKIYDLGLYARSCDTLTVLTLIYYKMLLACHWELHIFLKVQMNHSGSYELLPAFPWRKKTNMQQMISWECKVMWHRKIDSFCPTRK